MDTYKRIAYLHQVQSLLNDIGESKKKQNQSNRADASSSETPVAHCHSHRDDGKPLIRLNSFFGHLSKEIAMKHNIQILNCDQMRQFRCKRCFCQYDFHQMSQQHPKGLIQLQRSKSSKVSLQLTCPQCSYVRKVIFHKSIKTKYERILAEQEAANKPKTDIS